jgi:HTH-type transcriptional regulator/antitoxin HigA
MTMATKAKRPTGAVSPRYLELIRAFPLRPLKDDADLDAAIAAADALVDRGGLTSEEEDYLDVLSDLIERYEDVRHPMPEVSGVEMLRYLITDARQITQAEAAEGAGIKESTLSEILTGRRKVNARHARAFGKFFGLDPGVFLAE